MAISEIYIGLDIGSTTVKVIVLNSAKEVVFCKYQRHFSEVRKIVAAILQETAEQFSESSWHLALSGSGAITLASELGVPFVQEVIASGISIRQQIPDADVAIELGGEDAKLTFLTGGFEQRMNETCAGGTGAFIDQMAAFIQTDAAGLDELAQRCRTIYPIASRCGVFAKTDVLPLLNEGCSKEDIAASIMQAVVDQTISGLARGRTIRGKVVFLGGPLTFLQSLRDRFVATLHLTQKTAVFPPYGEYFVALGAALQSYEKPAELRPLSELITAVKKTSEISGRACLPPLFNCRNEYEAFRLRHSKKSVFYKKLEECSGDAWLGFDSGSTTIKAVLIDRNANILYSSYSSNRGDPLNAAVDILKEIYARKRDNLTIRAAAVTGYGSSLLAAGLGADFDEVETVAHFTAARFFEPKVSFILDIGGQDIKCMWIRNGIISRIQLNEACSAGCGSFIENFAGSLQMPLEEFVEAALRARAPVDLGTRCTVFMNSKVRQAQKDGIGLGDIAAGLSYSVIRNACFKVIKITDVKTLGDHVVAQGGAFLNDALLRALELELGCTVSRPAISGLMGAFGVALIARDNKSTNGVSKLISPQATLSFSANTTSIRCRHCSNRCLLTVTVFADGQRFISGNRCERGAEVSSKNLPNLHIFKYKRLFEPYVPLREEAAPRGSVGIPRALNIYENYPLWFTLFTRLGFRVVLSAPSTKELFHRGYGTIPSQTVCYPAKLAHGHILDLIDKKVDCVFFPCLSFEHKDIPTQSGRHNCPVVAGYPELLAKNIDALRESGIPYFHPFLPMERHFLARRLRNIPLFANIPFRELDSAVQAGFDEQERFRCDMRREGEKVLAQLREKGDLGIILAGHPYHVDPEVSHGISELINSCGVAVLTEDSVAHLKLPDQPLRVVDQWNYHSRLYRAGAYAATTNNLAVIQLISFGCGLDAVTTDQLEEIITSKGRLYAMIKIDEGANLGSARIRIRSLLAALRRQLEQKFEKNRDYCEPPLFSSEMRKTHTILIPQMSPIHFQFVETVFAAAGYKVALLPSVDRGAIDLGLRYVNNDACFPAIVVVGQLLQALHSGKYNPDRVALLISQTGGGCRATNYIGFLRKALIDSGFGHVPIVSFNMDSRLQNPGFRLSGKMLCRIAMAGLYGDAMMRMLCRVSPYEVEAGSAERLAKKWSEYGKRYIVSGNVIGFHLCMLKMIRAFDRLPLKTEKRRPRVGLVGEILLKYHPDANNQVIQLVEREGGEAVVTDLMNYVLYSFYDHVFNYRHMAGSLTACLSGLAGIFFLEFSRWTMRLGFKRSRRFSVPIRFKTLRDKARNLIALGHQSGEGWLLAAEMVELLEEGINNILCIQPFGCLPNHITGKGLQKELKQRFPKANIIMLDYDSGASEVNQINRIKLMMSIARDIQQEINDDAGSV